MRNGTCLVLHSVFPQDREKRYENRGGAFMTGVDIFAKEEQIKLDERAKRFGLDPSDAKPVTEQQIIELYKR